MALKPRIYLETTIFNYYFLDDPERKEDILATKKLLEEINSHTKIPSPLAAGF